MSNLLPKEIHGRSIRFKEDNQGVVWVNLTDIAKATKTRVNTWYNLYSTKEYLVKLQSIAQSKLIYSTKTGTDAGMWAVEELAEQFYDWCSNESK